MALVVVRVAAVALVVVLVALAVRFRKRTLSVLRRFWLEPSSPVNLAIWRIALFALILRSALGQRPLWYASFPVALREPLFGWGWLGELPFDEGLVSGAQDALIVSALAAALGLFTRVSAPVAALLAVYVLGLPNFISKIDHANTARILCALAVAFAPCGDALSLDALIRRGRGRAAPAPSVAYGIPLRFAWVLIGTTYFFPGFWKLWNAGDLWLTGKALAYQLSQRWAVLPDLEPSFRVDRHPLLLALLGTATLLFEIGFVFALLGRVSRTVAALSAAAFHLGVAHFMKIHFSPFFPLLVLVEVQERWDAVKSRLPTAALEGFTRWRERFARLGSLVPRASPLVTPKHRPFGGAWPATVVGAALVSAQVVAGFARVSSWPITVYPTFAHREEEPRQRGRRLRVALESKGEEPVDLHRELKQLGSARLRTLLRSTVDEAARGSTEEGRTLLDVSRHAGVHVEAGDRFVVYEATWDVLPPGKRRRYREKEVGRYRVTREGTLVLLR